MEFKPELIVIAGPNGAGKSTSSSAILSKKKIIAFDWDQHFYSLWSKFDFDPILQESTRQRINDMFELEFESNIKKKTSMAFETNFHQDSTFKLTERAKSHGFNTVLIFMLVNSIDKCIDRVEKRVKLGGHYVNSETISHRYKEGLMNLKIACDYFNEIFIFDTSVDFEIRNIYNIRVDSPAENKIELSKILDAYIKL